MSGKSTPVPDAWDDEDWESQADVSTQSTLSIYESLADDLFQKLASELANTQTSEQGVSAKASKAQRRAQHVEFNRQLWAEAYVSIFQIISYSSLVSKIESFVTAKPRKLSTFSKPAPPLYLSKANSNLA